MDDWDCVCVGGRVCILREWTCDRSGALVIGDRDRGFLRGAWNDYLCAFCLVYGWARASQEDMG